MGSSRPNKFWRCFIRTDGLFPAEMLLLVYFCLLNINSFTSIKSWVAPFLHFVAWYKFPSLRTNKCFFQDFFPSVLVQSRPSAWDDLHKSEEKKVCRSDKRFSPLEPSKIAKKLNNLFSCLGVDFFAFKGEKVFYVISGQLSILETRDPKGHKDKFIRKSTPFNVFAFRNEKKSFIRIFHSNKIFKNSFLAGIHSLSTIFYLGLNAKI